MGLSSFSGSVRCRGKPGGKLGTYAFIDSRHLVDYRNDMPQTARALVGSMWYHALSRGNRREAVFHKPGDYHAFVEAIIDARARLPVDLLGYCLMPNHFHLVLRPHHDGDLGRWMQWLLTTHAQRDHRHYGTTGHVWQGRFKAFSRCRRRCAAIRHLEVHARIRQSGQAFGKIAGSLVPFVGSAKGSWIDLHFSRPSALPEGDWFARSPDLNPAWAHLSQLNDQVDRSRLSPVLNLT